MEVTLSSDKKRRTPWLRIAVFVGIAVASVLLWDSWLLWPLKIAVVLFHELSHAVATWATGGTVLEIALSPMQGGHTKSLGGWRIVVLNAGYLGSMTAGVGLLALSRRSLTARAATAAIALSLLAVSAIYVPWISFGFAYTVLVALVCGAGAVMAPGFVLRHGMGGLGVFSIGYALYDVWSDVFVRALDPEVVSDATMLAELTGLPAMVWGGLWIVGGVALLIGARRLI